MVLLYFPVLSDPKPADKDHVNVIFLLDASIGVRLNNFEKQKDFVKVMARSFQLPIRQSKMAAFSYGAFTAASGKLNTYQSLNEFDRDVDALQLISGQRRMDEALNAASNIIRQDTSPVRNIIVLLTAGRQARLYQGLIGSNYSKVAQDVGAEMYVVAIGREPSLDELRPIVVNPEDIYPVGSFDYLQREAQPIGNDIITSKWSQTHDFF